MAAIATVRCPTCGVLNALDQTICRSCLGALPALSPDAVQPMTGETCHMYQAGSGHALLLFSRTTLEYSATGIAFTTAWHNVATITHTSQGMCLWLYQTPQQITLPLGSNRLWYADGTRSIPLEAFGYPTNASLAHDLWCYAPQLRRFIPHAALSESP